MFSADVDFATSGMVSLTSCERNEVVATMTTAQEWKAYDLPAIESRINAALGRSDLRCVDFIARRGDRLYYREIHVPNGKAVAVREQSLSDYVESGGVIKEYEFRAEPDAED